METGFNNPAERKKLIGAIVLGLLAIILLWWAFIGFGSSTTTNTGARVTQRPGPAGVPTPGPRAVPSPTPSTGPDVALRPVKYDFSVPAVPEARRNIFIYYEKPPPVIPPPPSPTPPPPPPVLLASVSPSTVYARTGDFTMEVTGDKFTPQLRIVVDGMEFPARYRSAQQMSAVIPAAAIANPGSRQVTLRSPDGKLFSNGTTFNVQAPPTPNFTYVGIIGTPRYVDTAILQDKASREIMNVQKGDLLGNRFRVTSISEKEVVTVDTSLKIRHTIPFTSGQTIPGGPTQRPTPRVETEDDEP